MKSLGDKEAPKNAVEAVGVAEDAEVNVLLAQAWRFCAPSMSQRAINPLQTPPAPEPTNLEPFKPFRVWVYKTRDKDKRQEGPPVQAGLGQGVA